MGRGSGTMDDAPRVLCGDGKIASLMRLGGDEQFTATTM
jgi:hypothetical protein